MYVKNAPVEKKINSNENEGIVSKITNIDSYINLKLGCINEGDMGDSYIFDAAKSFYDEAGGDLVKAKAISARQIELYSVRFGSENAEYLHRCFEKIIDAFFMG